jgi:hypothetical protein
MAIGNKFESTVDWTSSKMTESTIGLKKLDEFRMTREKLEAEKEAMDRAKKAETELQKQYVNGPRHAVALSVSDGTELNSACGRPLSMARRAR